jgi:6,7-dimethyl-8-ribityllumazine synthase
VNLLALKNLFLEQKANSMSSKNQDFSFYNNEEVPNAKGLTFSIVVSEWNINITKNLYKGAYDILVECGAVPTDISKYSVPGSFELVYGAKIAAKSKPSAIICLGSIIKGETRHFDFVSNAVSMGIMDLNLNLDIPVIFGVLTDDTMSQAINRSGGKYGNKGVEAAITAIKMAVLND